MNVNLSDHLLQVFCGTASIPTSMKSKVIWGWDDNWAHLETYAGQLPRDQDFKGETRLFDQVFQEFHCVRDLAEGGDCFLKASVLSKTEMKFVVHDSTIARDFISNLELYEQTLREVVNTFSKFQDLVEEARGFLSYLTDEQWLLDVQFLVAVTRILKRFSTEFQVSFYHVKQLKYFTQSYC